MTQLTLAQKLAALKVKSTPPASVGIIDTATVPNAPAEGFSKDDLMYAAKLGEGIELLEGFKAAQFYLKLEEVNVATLEGAPGLPSYLETINQQLNQFPELVHKLSPEKVAIVVQGALKITQTVMTDVIKKKKSKLTAAEITDLEF